MDEQAVDQTVSETPTSPPPPAERNESSESGNAAPPVDLDREAFRRLARGEKPEEVNRQVFAKPSGKEATAAPQPAANEANDKAKPQPQAKADDSAKWPEGMADKDVNVLRRAKMDADTWSAIPPSNRVKILTNLRTSQSAADREFQQRQTPNPAGKPGEASQTDALSGGQTTDGESETDTDTQDAATGATDEGREDRGAKPTATDAGAVPDYSGLLEQADLETLDLIGGQELAGTMQRVLGRVASHYETRQATLLQGMEYLLNQHVGREFNGAVDELAKQPGMDRLTEQSDEGDSLRSKLREKAMLLHRAGGDPKGYPFAEAVRDAAASLLKTNVHQTHQARLLKGRADSLSGSAERGSSRVAQGRALNPAERSKAIFRNLAKGLAPDDARLAVDGS